MISKPQRLRVEISFTSRLLAVQRLDALTALLEEVDVTGREDLHDKPSMLRLAFDAAERLWSTRSDADACFWFRLIQKSVSLYRDEPDVVVSGLRLLGVIHTALEPSLSAELLNLVMDSVQRFSPPSPAHRTRVLRRLEYAQDTELMFGVVMSKRSGHAMGTTVQGELSLEERPEATSQARSLVPILDSDVRIFKPNDTAESLPPSGASSSEAPSGALSSASVVAKKGWSRTKGDTGNVQRWVLCRYHTPTVHF